MKSFLSSVTLTGGITLGLMGIHSPAAQGFSTWSFSIDGPSQDCYLDETQGGTSCADLKDSNNDYVSTGFNNGGNQIAFFQYDLADVITTIQTEVPDSAFIVVTSAAFSAFQSTENTANPNNPTASRPTNLPSQRVLFFRGRETLLDWDETDPTFTYNNFFNTGNIDDQLDTTNLVSGGIAADFTGTTNNIFTGTNLNDRLTEIIGGAVEGSSTKSDLSLAFQATSGFNFPSLNLFPIEDLVSKDVNPAQDMSLDLEIAVFSKLDFDLFTRAGTSARRFDDWESALRNKTNSDLPIIEADFDWSNGRDANRIFFELNYDDTNGDTELVLFRNDPNNNLIEFFRQAIDTDPDNTDVPSIEGFKLYTNVQTAFCPGSTSSVRVAPGTNSRLRVTSVTSVVDGNDNTINVPTTVGTVNAQVPNGTSIPSSNAQEIVLPFIDLGIDKAKKIEGNFTIGWDGGENPQTSCGQLGGKSRVQMLLEPLTTLPDTRSAPDSEFLSASSDEVGVQSVPEPATVIGLLFFGLAGIGCGRSSDDQE